VADVLALFEEYAAAYARGEGPRARDFLARAGGDADELAGLLDGFLRRAPAPRPDAEALAAVGALISREPPLVALRNERGIRVEQVVDALVKTLALDPKKRAKVRRHYQRLETGLLPPKGVSARVWDVVAGLLGPGAREAALGWRVDALAAPAPAYFRADAPAAAPAMRMRAAAEPKEPDEIDRLFGVTH
jgi:hypothetical protein